MVKETHSQQTNIKHLTYYGELTLSRSYVLYYSLHSDKKKVPSLFYAKLVDECFELALKRYGLSIPFPLFVSETFMKLSLNNQKNLMNNPNGTSLKVWL